ncbi:MAG: hypothetical protein MI743_01255 [Sneathiellales bacterium]|nr:hypothetical protein [Sneathiellales bacterium]
MQHIRKMIMTSILLTTAGTLSGCGDTWEGLKKDTRENLQAAENAISKPSKEDKKD